MEICGIDEAGRGALAGPLVVAGVVLKKEIVGLNDSKKLTPKKRELLFKEIQENSIYSIIFFSNDQIDNLGLSLCLKRALNVFLKRFNAYHIIFDGNTNYGVCQIQTMIKADLKLPQASAASILAKVSRDKFMTDISSNFPNYQYEKHKGYGTKSHLEAIQAYGQTSLSRKTFIIKKHQKTLF